MGSRASSLKRVSAQVMRLPPRDSSGTGILPVCRKSLGFCSRASQAGRPCHSVAAFTLAEVLAALLFLAIVIPTAVEALHIASLAGEVAARKSEAARVADRVLNENLVTTNWVGGMQNGTISEGVLDFKYQLTVQTW